MALRLVGRERGGLDLAQRAEQQPGQVRAGELAYLRRGEAVVAIRAGFSATMADGTAVGTPPWAV